LHRHYAGGINADVLEEIAQRAEACPTSVKHLLNVLETARQECGKDDAAISTRAFVSALALVPANDAATHAP
jgi:hypothetical protein